MKGGMILSFFSICTVAAIESIQNIPDIQASIWSYLQWEERLILREVSTSWHAMHLHIFPSENKILTQFMALSKHIHTIDPPKLVAFFVLKEDLRYTEPLILGQTALEHHGSILIEKILVDITERAPTFALSSRACSLWLKSFRARYPPFAFDQLHAHRWPQADDNGSVIPSEENLHKLARIFRIANTEMQETKSKYNRYTRFAFKFLDSFLISLDSTDRSKQWVSSMRKQLWNDISSVEFITDYLMRPFLRDFQGPATTAIELIMCDATRINDSLNTDRLLLMVRHPRILFNFNVVYFELIESPIWSKKTRSECLQFIVDRGLMTWSLMEEHMRDYRSVYPEDPVIQSMWRYVYCQQLREKWRQRDYQCGRGNPLVRKKRVRNEKVQKPVRQRHACCLCM